MSRMNTLGLAAFLVTTALLAETAALAFQEPGGSGRYEVEILVNGVPAREFYHRGGYYVMGTNGDRYSIRVRNRTGRRVEVVASVDGLDVVDGRKADYVNKRGYVLGPWQTFDIEGFRLDMNRVAAFRFSAVSDSYAAKQGDDRNVGVIGVAFFEERRPVVRRPMPIARPEQAQEAESSRAYRLSDPGSGGARSRTTVPEKSAGAGSGFGRVREYGVAKSAPAAERPGLGTEFGEARSSQVVETAFHRASPRTPTAVFVIYYNDRDGLIAMGVPVDSCAGDTCLRKTANPFPANPADRRFAVPPPGWCD